VELHHRRGRLGFGKLSTDTSRLLPSEWNHQRIKEWRRLKNLAKLKKRERQIRDGSHVGNNVLKGK